MRESTETAIVTLVRKYLSPFPKSLLYDGQRIDAMLVRRWTKYGQFSGHVYWIIGCIQNPRCKQMTLVFLYHIKMQWKQTCHHPSGYKKEKAYAFAFAFQVWLVIIVSAVLFKSQIFCSQFCTNETAGLC